MKKNKKIISVILILILTILSSVALYIKNKVDKVSDEKSNYKTVMRKEVPQATDPIGVLLIGTDDGKGRSVEEGARSDTLIYATINPKTKETNLYSISRDIFTKVQDENYQKINAAYSLGKEEQASKAVEYLLDAPVDYYISVNMDALSDIVDTLGGIDVENKLGIPISISDTEPSFEEVIQPGKQHINGNQALVYSRMRYQDPEGDVGRQKRQQEVIREVVKKLKSPSVILKLDKLLDVVGNNVKTNASTSKIVDLFKSYLGALEKIESTNIIGRGQMIQNGYYMILGKNNILEIQNKIKKELNLEEKDELSWITDENMLYVDDSILSLDPSVHYEFSNFSLKEEIIFNDSDRYDFPVYTEPVPESEPSSSTLNYYPPSSSSEVVTEGEITTSSNSTSSSSEIIVPSTDISNTAVETETSTPISEENIPESSEAKEGGE